MAQPKQIMIEGYTAEEILSLPEKEIDQFVLCDEPIIFKAGSAELLGQFRVESNALVVEMAQIDGGGEGVLPTLWVLAEQCAIKKGLHQVEWIVHAVNCARPNTKLRRALERRGFVIRDIPGIGETFHLAHNVGKR